MFVLGKGGGGVVELARCMLHPGHKKGFNMHKYYFGRGDSNEEM